MPDTPNTDREQGVIDGLAFASIAASDVDAHAAYLQLLDRIGEPGIAQGLNSEYHLGFAVLVPAAEALETHGASPDYLRGFYYGFARGWHDLEQG